MNKTFLLALLLLVCGLGSHGQTSGTTRQDVSAAVEKEIRAFYDSYAEDLRLHRRSEIAARYDDRGAYLLGQGKKSLQTFDVIRERYLNKWNGPKAFEWKDLSIEVLSPGTAVVLARFDWHTAGGQVFNYSYTGVLIKRGGRWRIRVEDESGVEIKKSANP
jgi:hypothetical protein